ncbi:phosphopantetheine-binding protein [Kribbella sp. NPDC005582]|uniref:phosphopantetheine-binding protein n=1 Tax=Kribbella sp. NPDC005582 TaxID=3156893 RepID=UPI0033AAB532
MRMRTVAVDTWRDVLQVEAADESDNFFESGGDSMLALELLQRLETETGIEIPVETLFVDGTLGAIIGALVSPEQ